jgi:hypothetical protein
MNSEVIEMLEAEWRDRLKAAVLAEREACAKVCETVNWYDSKAWASDIAAAIRARGQV